MNKKIIVLIIVIIIILAGVGAYFLLNDSDEKESNNMSNNQTENQNNNDNNHLNVEGKSVVIYFSATGTTKKVAEYISEVSDSDIIEIIPKNAYTSDDLNYGNDNSRANKEQNDSSSRPEIKNDIDVTDYDVIYLGYPIWWGDVPKIILTFVENNNLQGKTIIPFCTSGSSGISQSINTLKSYKDLNVEAGRRFGSSTTKDDIKSWLK